MRATLNNLTFDRKGLQLVTLAVQGDFRERYDELNGKDLDVEIKIHRNRRSLSANAYFHVLVNKIAAVLKESDEDIKTRLVVDYGVIAKDGDGQTIGFKLPASVDVDRIYKYTRLFDQRTENGKLFNCYIVYKPSHEMNTAEMSRLIDGTIEEAKGLGIETDTPETLARLKEEWARHEQIYHAG